MIISGNEQHHFICSDTETSKLLFINEIGKITQEICDVIGAFDLWVLPNGDILYAHNSGRNSAGVTLLSSDGTVKNRYLTGKEIFSCQPLKNGHVLLGLLGEPQLLEIDFNGNIFAQIHIPYEGPSHEGMRLARKIGNAYLLVQPGTNKILKLSLDGKIIQEFDIHHDAFGFVVLPDNHILYTCMSGAYELDENGNEVWSLTNSDVPEINIRWLLGVQRLSNGNFVFTNWMGHGHLGEGIHFFEVNRSKEVVWSLDSRNTLKTPAVLQVLDEDPVTVCFTPMK